MRSLNNQVIMLFWITGNNAYCCFEQVFPIPPNTFLQFVDYRYRHALREKSNMGTVYWKNHVTKPDAVDDVLQWLRDV